MSYTTSWDTILLNIWEKSGLTDGGGLPEWMGQIFTELCDPQVERYRHGRVLLASRLIALFRVDATWARANLLPHFSWARNPAEARRVWEGFLWSPRLYRPLLLAYKAEFRDTASHYADLGEHGEQFAAIFTYAALGPLEGYTAEEFREAFSTQGVARSGSSPITSAGRGWGTAGGILAESGPALLAANLAKIQGASDIQYR